MKLRLLWNSVSCGEKLLKHFFKYLASFGNQMFHKTTSANTQLMSGSWMALN